MFGLDDILAAALVSGGVGGLKSALIDVPKANRQRKLAAATQRYSPWTGLQANPVQEADPFGSALQYGVTGASMGQNVANQKTQAALSGKVGDSLDAEIALNKAKTAQLMPAPPEAASNTPPASQAPPMAPPGGMDASGYLGGPRQLPSFYQRLGINPWMIGQ